MAGQHLIKRKQLATVHLGLETPADIEGLFDHDEQVIIDHLVGWLADVHELEVVGHLRQPVVLVVTLSNAHFSELVAEPVLALLNGP